MESRISPARRVSRFAAALLAASLALPAAAQIVAPGGRTLFNKAVMVRTFVRFDTFAPPAPGVRVRRLMWPTAVVWSPYPHWNLTFVSPIVSVERQAPGGETRTTGSADGFVFARYDLVRRNVPRGFTRLSPLVGAKIPTGAVFGNHSTDPLAGIVFSRVRDPHWFVLDTQFTYAREGDAGVRRGNQWLYDVAYVYRLLPREDLDIPTLYGVVEINGRWEGRTRVDGVAQADSGGNVVYLSPGLEYMPSKRVVLELSVPIAAVRNLNGDQLRPRVSFITGVRWLF